MPVSERIPVMAGNWKMFKTIAQTMEYLEKFRVLVEDASGCEIVIAPTSLALAKAAELVAGSRIRIAAQNLHWENEGAFTGEVSASMLVAAGASDVIIGHSERRQYFGETGEMVSRKVLAAPIKQTLLGKLPVGTPQHREATRDRGRRDARF